MLERCIKLEPLFTAAYLELVKLYSGLKAGQLLRRVVQLNPYDVDLRRQYGDWLMEQNLLLEAIVQYQEGLKIMETHQLSVIGACRALRRLGQHSRLHQLILSPTDPAVRSHSSVESEISIRILRTPHCNRSEHLSGSLKHCKTPPGSSSSPSQTASRVKSSSSRGGDGKTTGKHKKWPKSRHKSKGPTPTVTDSSASSELEPSSGDLSPLLVSNILDKL
ncbi:hypothetical protein RP20_CCG025792 [Aedes albopictus]|nr:hypothetical protein RP20_CCG025792 [Aedes albopictus]